MHVGSPTATLRELLAAMSLAALALTAAPAAQPVPQAGPALAALPVLDDVEAAFAGVARTGESLAISIGGLIARPAYRTSLDNGFGFDNHFQGIQRIGASDVLVLSGADAAASTADLFIVKLDGPGTGALVSALTLDDEAWHAGGIAAQDSILAVPRYDSGGSRRKSRVRFYDVSDPIAPRQLPVSIERDGRKAIAVALTRLVNAHWLVAVLSGRDGEPRRLDLYLSRGAQLADGFGEPLGWQTAFVRARNGQAPSFSHFQNINFLPQADGRLYLVGFHNTFVNVAALPGRDYADLYEVILPECVTRAHSPLLAHPHLVKVANKRLACRGGACNLDAAAGVHVDPASRSLSIYAAPGWLDGDSLKLMRYREPAARISK